MQANLFHLKFETISSSIHFLNITLAQWMGHISTAALAWWINRLLEIEKVVWPKIVSQSAVSTWSFITFFLVGRGLHQIQQCFMMLTSQIYQFLWNITLLMQAFLFVPHSLFLFVENATIFKSGVMKIFSVLYYYLILWLTWYHRTAGHKIQRNSLTSIIHWLTMSSSKILEY